jgi:hypothetical protein
MDIQPFPGMPFSLADDARSLVRAKNLPGLKNWCETACDYYNEGRLEFFREALRPDPALRPFLETLLDWALDRDHVHGFRPGGPDALPMGQLLFLAQIQNAPWAIALIDEKCPSGRFGFPESPSSFLFWNCVSVETEAPGNGAAALSFLLERGYRPDWSDTAGSPFAPRLLYETKIGMATRLMLTSPCPGVFLDLMLAHGLSATDLSENGVHPFLMATLRHQGLLPTECLESFRNAGLRPEAQLSTKDIPERSLEGMRLTDNLGHRAIGEGVPGFVLPSTLAGWSWLQVVRDGSWVEGRLRRLDVLMGKGDVIDPEWAAQALQTFSSRRGDAHLKPLKAMMARIEECWLKKTLEDTLSPGLVPGKPLRL